MIKQDMNPHGNVLEEIGKNNDKSKPILEFSPVLNYNLIAF